MLPRATIAVVDCRAATGSVTVNALSSTLLLTPAPPAHPAAIAAPATTATNDSPELRMGLVSFGITAADVPPRRSPCAAISTSENNTKLFNYH
jgi:hypothetical protein